MAIQVVVTSELDDSELLLKALRPGINRAMFQLASEFPEEDEEYQVSLATWFMVVMAENEHILKKEGVVKRHDDYADVVELLAENGLLTKYEEKYKQEGWREGVAQSMNNAARAMKSESIAPDTISKITGLTVDEIRRL
ncbi:MAG: hypothetical protein FWB85_11265 [Chitinispirillia bacterium]|nr:hypothetical protein [Chitinispirillia bacterium]MCL2184033.1 hypothetical protein [Chitinispirillia bacterium]